MRVDPHAQATRLLADQVPGDFYGDLVQDPVATIELLFEGLTVRTRPPSPPSDGCPVDGTYNPGPPPRILVADDVVPARQRFTVLHELGHHLIENDGPLNELDVSGANRRDEAICNEVAASLLIPADVAERYIPVNFKAADVANLHANVEASRSACCVAAVRRLRHPGCVILGTAEGIAFFTAHQIGTPWAIARGTAQGDDSILARAGRSNTRGARQITHARYANGNTSGELHGDAYMDDDGWVFAVLVEDTVSPWETGLRFNTADTGIDYETIECDRHGEVRAWKSCPKCGNKICPECDRCWSCPVAKERKCSGYCQLMKPVNQFRAGSTVCHDCE
jgi:hypothetical protein